MKEPNRRSFVQATAAVGLAAVMPADRPALGADRVDGDAEEVAAAEDLMREHGVLNRVLLIYEEGLRRLRAKEDVTPEVFLKCATLVRAFVEDYHEKLEETFFFPEFEQKGKLADLVKILRDQHQAGRKLTNVILSNSVRDLYRRAEARQEMVRSCEAFIRMYRPHEAREDTVLFPALHKIVPARRLKELGEQFEKEEDRLFGEEGFEKTVDQVVVIEKELGIYDLAGFTPR